MAKKNIENNTYAHLQPQALDVERAVLGALMNDRDAYAVVCEILSPESFYEKRNQDIYSAIRDLSLAEKPVDVLTVTDELERQGNLDKVGGYLSCRPVKQGRIVCQHRIPCPNHCSQVSRTTTHFVRKQYRDKGIRRLDGHR